MFQKVKIKIFLSHLVSYSALCAMVDSPEVNPVLPVDETVDIVPCGSIVDSNVGVSVE